MGKLFRHQLIMNEASILNECRTIESDREHNWTNKVSSECPHESDKRDINVDGKHTSMGPRSDQGRWLRWLRVVPTGLHPLAKSEDKLPERTCTQAVGFER